jgi:prolyl oligopeptidase
MSRLEFEDLLAPLAISSPYTSHTTESIVFSVGEQYSNANTYLKSAVYRLNKSGRMKKLTSGEFTDTSPKPSPDGEVVGFLSNRFQSNAAGSDDRPITLCFIPAEGGEISRSRIPGSVESFLWLDNRLVLAIAKEQAERNSDSEGADTDEIIVERRTGFRRLWIIDSLTGTSKRVKNDLNIWEVDAVSTKATAIAVVSDLPFERSWYNSRLTRINLEDGSYQDLYRNPGRQVGSPRLSADGKHALFMQSLWSDRGVQSGDVCFLDIESGKLENITRDMELSVSWAEWVGQDAILVANQRSASLVLKLRLDNLQINEIWRNELTINPSRLPKFSLLNDSIVFSSQSAHMASDIWRLDLRTKDFTRLTHFGVDFHVPDVTQFAMNKYKWVGSAGVELEGFVRGGQNLGSRSLAPLIVQVHGGPTGSVRWQYMDGGEVFASKGYVVFYPNFTGSTGRGVRFAESNIGDMGGQDLQDIISGVQSLVERGGIDEKRIYLTGGSYGGYMTMWGVTQTNIFAGAVARFGISDWLSFHGCSSLSDWDAIHYNESPYSFHKFVDFSPIRHVQNVKTPLLLLHGERDPFVPVGQSLQFFRALNDLGKEVSLIVYPREGHGFTERAHVLDANRRTLSWFETHRKPE